MVDQPSNISRDFSQMVDLAEKISKNLRGLRDRLIFLKLGMGLIFYAYLWMVVAYISMGVAFEIFLGSAFVMIMYLTTSLKKRWDREIVIEQVNLHKLKYHMEKEWESLWVTKLPPIQRAILDIRTARLLA